MQYVPLAGTTDSGSGAGEDLCAGSIVGDYAEGTRPKAAMTGGLPASR